MSPRNVTPAPPANRADPYRDPALEERLSSRGFEWTLNEELPVELFDQDTSLKNQARVGKPLNRETVTQYVTALGNGDVFPAITAAGSLKVKGLVIVDGNHRYDAFLKADRKIIPAYLITNASPQALVQLTFEANTRHGLPTSIDDRIQHGLYMVDSGMSAEQAARQLAIPVAKLRTAINVAEADGRAREVNIQAARWDRLTQGTRLRLNQIPDNDIFAEVTKLTLDAALTSEELNTAINDLRGLRTHGNRLDYIQRLRSGYAERLQRGGVRAPKGSQKRSARQALAMFLGQATVLPSAASIAERMTEADKKEMARRIDEVRELLGKLKAELTA